MGGIRVMLKALFNLLFFRRLLLNVKGNNNYIHDYRLRKDLDQGKVMICT